MTDGNGARQATREARRVTEARECRSCKALILWATTKSGKSMPMDVGPVADGGFVLALQGGEFGRLSVEKFYEPKHAGRNRFTSHFATCPNAKEHRRER